MLYKLCSAWLLIGLFTFRAAAAPRRCRASTFIMTPGHLQSLHGQYDQTRCESKGQWWEQHGQRKGHGSTRRTAVAVSHPSERGVLDKEELQAELFSQFRGLFDNEDQVKDERAAGLNAGPDGGHEQIHCKLEVMDQALPRTLIDQALHVVGATYYFDNNPDAVFRCRLYSFHDPSRGSPASDVAEMRLMRFTPAFEARLREGKYDLKGLLPRDQGELKGAVEVLRGCEVVWSWDAEASAFLGRMKHGGCKVESQRAQGVSLWIEDDLRLEGRGERLHVNDRGFDCEGGGLVYGNHKGVPYQMQRRRNAGEQQATAVVEAVAMTPVAEAEDEEGELESRRVRGEDDEDDDHHDDDDDDDNWDEVGIFCTGDECSLDWMWDDDGNLG